ncbi:hypothetical protein XELAEV_18012892mg [Xenopus laevis]|uniref:Uncharacterized protein n=1 Tax=Xenopus laevis TaxID=8355 RepID=A0A974HYJ8_XENLA|nr:hypothetical protein XELAEV_18012892mg [Xenopus laevis]
MRICPQTAFIPKRANQSGFTSLSADRHCTPLAMHNTSFSFREATGESKAKCSQNIAIKLPAQSPAATPSIIHKRPI